MGDELHLFEPGDPVVVRGPWVAQCGDPGPYAIARPTPKSPFRLQVLTCTRAAGHDPRLHQHAAHDRGVIAEWGRDGAPTYPPVLNPRRPARPTEV